jgi:hypothetical protein
VQLAAYGLTVNVKKTKVMLIAGAKSEGAALQLARRAKLTYGAVAIDVVPQFKYLGGHFSLPPPSTGVCCTSPDNRCWDGSGSFSGAL